MSGRWKGIILNLLVPGAGFMAQGRWGWGIFYFLIGLALAVPTFLIGTIIVAIISSIHSGVWGDAPKKDALSQQDVERLAGAMKGGESKLSDADVERIAAAVKRSSETEAKKEQ